MKAKYRYQHAVESSLGMLNEIILLLSNDGWEPISIYCSSGKSDDLEVTHYAWFRKEVEPVNPNL